MDKSRKPSGEKPKIKELLLPTLFEYGDTKRIADWGTNRKVWLKLINVAEAGTKKNSISRLPDLTTGLRGMGIASTDDDCNGNNVPELPSRGCDELRGQEKVLGEDGELNCLDGVAEIKYKEKAQGNKETPSVDVEAKTRRVPGESTGRDKLCRLERTTSLGSYGIRGGKGEKMESVRQWVKDQSHVNREPKDAKQCGSNGEKLPEMDIERKKRIRVHSVSEESLGLRNKMYGNDLLALNGGLKQASRNTSPRLSARLLEARQRETKAALAIEGLSLQTCDKGGITVDTSEHDVNNSHLIGTQCDRAQQPFMRLSFSRSLREQSMNDENSSSQDEAICATMSSNRLKAADTPLRSSSRESWLVVGCSTRCLVTNNSPLRRRPTPRPPPLIVRPPSSDTLDAKLSP